MEQLAADIIQNSIDLVEIEPELGTIERIEEGIKSINKLRQQKIDKLQISNDELNQDINKLNQEIKLLKTVSDHNHEIITQLTNISNINIKNDDLVNKNPNENIFHILNKKIIQLDNYKINIATSLIDLESSINSLSLTKTKLNQDYLLLKSQLDNSSQLNSNQDSSSANILKLSILKSLGIKIDSIDEKDHISIHNELKNLLYLLTVDDNLLDLFISNYIWDCLDDAK